MLHEYDVEEEISDDKELLKKKTFIVANQRMEHLLERNSDRDGALAIYLSFFHV